MLVNKSPTYMSQISNENCKIEQVYDNKDIGEVFSSFKTINGRSEQNDNEKRLLSNKVKILFFFLQIFLFF